MKLSPRSIGLIAAITTVLIWTSFIVIARASASHNLLPLDIGFLRILGASTVLLPWGWWLMRGPRQTGTATCSFLGLSPLPWRITAATGLFGGLLYAVLAYSGFFYAPALHASVLLPGSLPLWTSLLAMVILKDPISKNRAIGLACIVVGDVLVGGASLLKAFEGGEVWKGDVLFMSAAMCWGMYSVLVRRQGLNAIHATMAITAFACVTFVPIYGVSAWMGWIPSHLATAPLSELWFQAMFQGVGSVAISGITFNMMIRHYGPVRSTMITALVPGLSALGALAVLGEPMQLNVLAGLALVTCGILFGVRKA
ncbi:EamA family transporter [Limnohabitans sp. JirII-29]|uniref:DMT family transporter n=1 Tax=Limnohabitans sp. JirII-29 TaxID=1835756 RepID=UPI000D3C0377|nr:DMT family transporter [Limnohabitans sp. JirII-29]PUE26328.1 EamA family transporter [Limnohabitans sp. JirII-29]